MLYPLKKIKNQPYPWKSIYSLLSRQFFFEASSTLWSHFLCFTTLTQLLPFGCLWQNTQTDQNFLCLIVLKELTPPPLGGSHRISSLITAVVTQHTGLNPDRQISATATLSRTSLPKDSLCQRQSRPMSLRNHNLRHNPSQSSAMRPNRPRLSRGSWRAWNCECATVGARKHCQIGWNFKRLQ